MQYNFVIIRTNKGRKYARKILNSIKWLNEYKYPQHEFNTYNFTIAEFMDKPMDWWQNLDVNKTIIHPRCANPRTNWTERLRLLEIAGYKVVNSVDCIELTSNKLACSLALQGKVSHPKSWEYSKNMSNESKNDLLVDIEENLGLPNYIIAKPLTSLEQGANVKKVNFAERDDYEILEKFNLVPGNKIVVQEFVPYTALHRVIVIGGKALSYTFIDKPEWHTNGDWKVSCCLNRTTMKLNENANPELLELAEKTQKEVGGVINFIDIFEVDNGQSIYYTNAEINTACSLNIHERLARNAGRQDYNIHSRIAKQLVKELVNE